MSRFLSSEVSIRFESLINTRGGLGSLSPPLPTFRVRYTTRCVLEATGKDILQGSQQRLSRVTVTVSYSRIFFMAKQYWGRLKAHNLFVRKEYTAEGYSNCDSTEPLLTALI